MDETDITTEDLFRKVSNSFSFTKITGPIPGRFAENAFDSICIYGILASGAWGNVITCPT